MPPTLGNGKICYVEMQLPTLRALLSSTSGCSAGTSGNAATAAHPLTTGSGQ